MPLKGLQIPHFSPPEVGYCLNSTRIGSSQIYVSIERMLLERLVFVCTNRAHAVKVAHAEASCMQLPRLL